LRQYMAAGGKSFQPWLNQHAVTAISDVDGRMLANVNTPADWAEWSQAIDT
jgi:molybdopterin-guanine dinucleotide biosynthesis protein A